MAPPARRERRISNFAVWDDSIIEIMRKYGLLPPLAAGGLGLSGGQGEPAPY